jgi:hypothetical protein
VNGVVTILMQKTKMKIFTKPFLALSTVMALNLAASFPAATQEVDLDNLCRKFPLNSQCQDYSNKSFSETDDFASSSSRQTTLSRQTFCNKFPLNSQCQKPPVEVIKLNLDRSGEDDEWVRIEKQANKIKLSHTTRVKDGLVSGALNGALGFVPFPVPFVELNKYDWEGHQIKKVSFKSDRCETKNCIVRGKNTLILPQSSDIYGGLFTINYQEKDVRRSLSFKIPPDTEAETIDTVNITTQY